MSAPHCDFQYRVHAPYRFPDLPGTGGRLKIQPEDFVVEEMPAYEPCGEGDHLFLWIEKRDISSDYLVRHIARATDVAQRDIGTAGKKDRRAVTRQWVSIPAVAEPQTAEIETDQIAVLRAARHGNKLRTGHLRGNRFCIRVRDVAPFANERARRLADAILSHGFANYYGSQRFGSAGATVQAGWRILTGIDRPRYRGARLRFELSAVQSYLFNAFLTDRIDDGLINRVLAGDVMQVVASGGLFVADPCENAQERFEAGEIVMTGPLFGPKMRQPTADALEREQRVSAAYAINDEHWRRFKKLTRGARRALLVRPMELDTRVEADALLVRATLPPGCYATELLREIMKCDQRDDAQATS